MMVLPLGEKLGVKHRKLFHGKLFLDSILAIVIGIILCVIGIISWLGLAQWIGLTIAFMGIFGIMASLLLEFLDRLKEE